MPIKGSWFRPRLVKSGLDEAVAPRLRGGMGTSWGRKFVDPGWPHDKRMRARVLLGFDLLMLAGVSVISAHLLIVGNVNSSVVTLPTLLLLGLVPFLLRRTGSVTVPAALVLGWCVTALSFLGITENGMRLSLSPWAGLIALLCLYLLGNKLGAVFAAFVVLQAAVSAIVHYSGLALPLNIASIPGSPVTAVEAVIGISFIGAMGYHYESVRRRVLGELEDALVAVEHSESQLSALIENTSALICSVDRQHRLLAFNSAFARVVQSHSGVPPAAGDVLEQVIGHPRMHTWRPHIERVLARAEPDSFEERVAGRDREEHRETSLYPLVQNGDTVGLTLFSYDISERKRAEAEMRRLHEQLVLLSRRAGMAAVASEVLHNAGNILTSVSVSVSTVEALVRDLKARRLVQTVELLEHHSRDLGAFLHDDPRGRRVMPLLQVLARHFAAQERDIEAEVMSLRKSVEHLSHVIQAQQSYARSVSVIEEVEVDELIDAALSFQAARWESLGIAVHRRVATLPPLAVDKHKVLEILVNLLSNATQALIAGKGESRRLVIVVDRVDAGGGERVAIHVEDNGVGVAEEDRDKIFQLGFTTREDGHGIGLHSSANIARQLGGRLTLHSRGLGQGARFTLELPMRPPEDSAERRSAPGLCHSRGLSAR